MSQHIDPPMNQSSIVDNLTTDDGTKALSAAQGKNLKDQIPEVVNNLTSDSTTSALSAAQGKALNSKMPYFGSLRTISNCLLIGNLDGTNNNTGLVTSSSQYAPTDLSIGIREVYYYSSTSISVVIHGVNTSGIYAEWYRHYNGSTWTDWFKNVVNSKSTITSPVTFDTTYVDNVQANALFIAGRVAILKLNFRVKSAVAAATVLGTLSSDYRPSDTYFGTFGTYNDSQKAIPIRLNSSGHIYHDCNVPMTANVYYSGQIVYFL